LWPQKLKTFVKIKFASKVILFQECLEFKDAINLCYTKLLHCKIPNRASQSHYYSKCHTNCHKLPSSMGMGCCLMHLLQPSPCVIGCVTSLLKQWIQCRYVNWTILVLNKFMLQFVWILREFCVFWDLWSFWVNLCWPSIPLNFLQFIFKWY
jgi:hypothetical protein